MAKNPLKRPNKRTMALNKDIGYFIPIEEDEELQALEKAKQDAAIKKALDEDDEPHND